MDDKHEWITTLHNADGSVNYKPDQSVPLEKALHLAKMGYSGGSYVAITYNHLYSPPHSTPETAADAILKMRDEDG